MDFSMHMRQVGSVMGVMVLHYSFGTPVAIGKDLTTYRALGKCGVAVVLPKEMRSFKIVGFESKLCQRVGRCTSYTHCPGSELRGDGSAVSYYIARYAGSNRCEIEVEGEVGRPLGDGDPNRTWTTLTDLFGRVVLRDWPNGLLGTAFLPVDNTPSLWNRKYRSRFPVVQYFTRFHCPVRQFSPAVALEIVRSLHLVIAD